MLTKAVYLLGPTWALDLYNAHPKSLWTWMHTVHHGAEQPALDVLQQYMHIACG